jgi:transposase
MSFILGGKMSRQAITLNCSENEKTQLKKWSNGSKTEKRLHMRSRIILCCLNGKTNTEIAVELNINRLTVAKWRGRFLQEGLAGLRDSPRSGTPKKYDENLKIKILKKLESPPPKGQSTWDGRSLALAVEASDDAVWRVLRKEGIQLQRSRSWCVSTDKEFSKKSADIIGLYLNPPENALVICIDEKPSIQAIERKRGYVETSSGKIVQGMKSTYKRNGTLNLFAALNVATGTVKTQTTKQKKRPEFQAFLDEVMKEVSAEQHVHVILDNYCTHKRNDDWLSKHPNVTFHFTPTSASWLNQVEIWFGMLSRKALKNASFSSITDLRKAIEDFVEVYHENARPFIWRKREVKGSQLKNTITNFCN